MFVEKAMNLNTTESNGKDVTVKREMEVTEVVEDTMYRVSW